MIDSKERKEFAMKRVAVVYWSGTGNTEAMACQVAEGARDAGAETSIFSAEAFLPQQLENFDAFAFGCPAMGAEELEDSQFEPMFSACEAGLVGRPVALFGSYGWGDGEWMRLWENRCAKAGITLAHESVICCEAPDDAGAAACRELGKALA